MEARRSKLLSTNFALCAALLFASCERNGPQTSKTGSSAESAQNEASAKDTTNSQNEASAQSEKPKKKLRALGKHLAHGEALRLDPLPGRRDGRVDIKTTILRLQECGADGFVFDVGDGDWDWKDCQALAEAFDPAGLKLWITVRLPGRRANSNPHRGSYEKWANAIAALAEKHESVAAMLLRELEQGRNGKFLHAARTANLRDIVNAKGVSLLASAHDPDDAWIAMYKDSLDGISLRWTKFNQLSNLTGMLAGFKALSPKSWKRYLTLETRRWGASNGPPDPVLTSSSLQVARKRVDGVLLRQLDLRTPALHSPAAKTKNSAYFDVFKTFTTSAKR